jgi:hypothetical protein
MKGSGAQIIANDVGYIPDIRSRTDLPKSSNYPIRHRWLTALRQSEMVSSNNGIVQEEKYAGQP